MFPVRITLHCKSHKKNTAPSASTEYNIYAKFILTSVLSASHPQSPPFLTQTILHDLCNNTSTQHGTTLRFLQKQQKQKNGVQQLHR